MHVRQARCSAGASGVRGRAWAGACAARAAGRPLRNSSRGARVRASEPQVVCVGEALFDLIADQKGLPRDKVLSWTPYPGGAPCNVATALSHLGVSTLFVSALGRDERGEQLMALMKERGVDTSGVQRTDAPTRDVYVVRDEAGNREFAGFGLPTEQYCDCFIDADQLPLDRIKASKVLVIGTLGLAYGGTRAAMQAAAAAARAAGVLVMVDVNWRPVFWHDPPAAKVVIRDFLANADLIKISDEDIDYLYAMDIAQALGDPCSVSALLPNAKGVLVTAGAEGAAYCFKSAAKGEASGRQEVFSIEVADTTGAGDAFTAGFLFKLLEAGGIEQLGGDPGKLQRAVEWAVATGCLATTKPGAIAAQPTQEEVDTLVAAAASRV